MTKWGVDDMAVGKMAVGKFWCSTKCQTTKLQLTNGCGQKGCWQKGHRQKGSRQNSRQWNFGWQNGAGLKVCRQSGYQENGGWQIGGWLNGLQPTSSSYHDSDADLCVTIVTWPASKTFLRPTKLRLMNYLWRNLLTPPWERFDKKIWNNKHISSWNTLPASLVQNIACCVSQAVEVMYE